MKPIARSSPRISVPMWRLSCRRERGVKCICALLGAENLQRFSLLLSLPPSLSEVSAYPDSFDSMKILKGE